MVRSNSSKNGGRKKATFSQPVRMSYTEVLLTANRRGKRITWSAQTLDMGIEPFQVIVERLRALESRGAVRILCQQVERGKGGRWVDAVEFVRQ